MINKCPKCGSTEFDILERKGRVKCKNCRTELKEGIIDFERDSVECFKEDIFIQKKETKGV
jgi:transcription initiation factor TFIIIB Brf1 subunit/transcription initiation factor TFIIB